MTWLGVLSALLTAVGTFAGWLRNRQLIAAGRAQTDAATLKSALDESAAASEARDAVRVALNASLSGCATMTDSSAPIESHAPFCAVARPFLWSDRDTDETIRQAKEHNAAGAVLCRWGAPARLVPPAPLNSTSK